QMTMVANAYRTQTNAPDKAIVEILIVEFSGQLKGWWDYYITRAQKLEILNSVKMNEENEPILDQNQQPIENAVATLIFTISVHFVGDPTHIKDKNLELLSNLKCKKLSDFTWYNDTFLSRIMLRDDSNQPFWKEKFLVELLILLGEKVR